MNYDTLQQMALIRAEGSRRATPPGETQTPWTWPKFASEGREPDARRSIVLRPTGKRNLVFGKNRQKNK